MQTTNINTSQKKKSYNSCVKTNSFYKILPFLCKKNKKSLFGSALILYIQF